MKVILRVRLDYSTWLFTWHTVQLNHSSSSSSSSPYLPLPLHLHCLQPAAVFILWCNAPFRTQIFPIFHSYPGGMIAYLSFFWKLEQSRVGSMLFILCKSHIGLLTCLKVCLCFKKWFRFGQFNVYLVYFGAFQSRSNQSTAEMKNNIREQQQ